MYLFFGKYPWKFKTDENGCSLKTAPLIVSNVLFSALNEHGGWTPADPSPQGTTGTGMERDGEAQTKGQLRAKSGVLYLIYHPVAN